MHAFHIIFVGYFERDLSEKQLLQFEPLSSWGPCAFLAGHAHVKELSITHATQQHAVTHIVSGVYPGGGSEGAIPNKKYRVPVSFLFAPSKF